MFRRISLILLAVVCFRLCLTTNWANGQPAVVLSGTYDYKSGIGDGPPEYEEQYDFEAQVDGCRWTINYTNRAFYANPGILNYAAIASCDGTNIHRIQFQSEEGNKLVWKEKYEGVRGELPTALGEIFVGVVPPPTDRVLQSLWTAFASGCVLKEQSGTVKVSDFEDLVVFYNTNFFSNYFWSTNADQQSDRQLILTTSGSHFGLDTETGKLRWFVYPSPYDHGFTNAIGIWHQTTNINGVLFPLNFEFRSFAPLALVRGDKPSLQRVHVYRCMVKNVSLLPEGVVPVLPPKGHVLVFDRHLQSQGIAKFSYTITNGLWLAANSQYISNRFKYESKSTLYDEAVIGHGLVSPQKAPRKYLIWILLALPSLFLLGKLVLGKIKQQQQNKQNK
jgi:hypothetical protein